MSEFYSDIDLSYDIWAFLEEKGLSVNAAAFLMGVPQRSLADFLNNKSRPRMETMERYLAAFEALKELIAKKEAAEREEVAA